MLCLSNAKAKRKNKKKKKGASPSAWAAALGEDIYKKNGNILPRVLGTRHSGKRIFLKKKNSSPSVALGEEFFFLKKLFLPRVLHSGKGKKPGDGVNGVKSSPRARLALGKGFPECKKIGTRGRALPREKHPR
jgi:hypothetical protein